MKNKKTKIQIQPSSIRQPKLKAKSTNPNYLVLLFVIVLVSFIVYLPALHNQFVWDDDQYIKDNPLIHSINLKKIFSTYISGNYHPFTMLTFSIEYYFFGTHETNYHMFNILLHLVNVILVFYTIYHISGKTEIALFASLLFGIHPIHVESVAWISELKDLLYTLFFLLSYIFYLRFIKEHKKKFYFYCLLLFILSLLSKAMAVSLPVLLLVTDYFKGRKITLKLIVEKIPFFFLAIALGIIAICAQKSSNAIQELAIFTFPQRIIFASYSFVSYFIKFFLPTHLSAFYPYPLIRETGLPFLYYIYLTILIGIVAGAFYSLRYSPKIIFGIGFFSVTIFLVLQLLPVGSAMMADRYSYIPSIGIFYLAGEGFYSLWSKKYLRIPLAIITLIISSFFSVLSYQRCSVWKNGMTLWSDVIDKEKNVAIAYNNRGLLFAKNNSYDNALNDYNYAISNNSTYADAFYNRGICLKDMKRYNEAFKDFNKAIELKPGWAPNYINRGFLWWNEKKYDEAIKDYNKAIELNQNFPEPYYNRAIIENTLGNKEASCIDLQKAMELGLNQAIDLHNQWCH